MNREEEEECKVMRYVPVFEFFGLLAMWWCDDCIYDEATYIPRRRFNDHSIADGNREQTGLFDDDDDDAQLCEHTSIDRYTYVEKYV